MFAGIPSVSGGILSSQLAKIKALTRDPNRTFLQANYTSGAGFVFDRRFN
jgi:hypothetical protein